MQPPFAPSALPLAQRALFPVLKEAGWAHQGLAWCIPLPAFPRADAPLLALAEDNPGGYVFVTRAEAEGHDMAALYQSALQRLAARPTDLAAISPSVAACAGKDLSAERILDPNFLRTLHHALRSDDLWVCVPHRVALYAVRADAPAADLAQFVSLVSFDARRGPELGHAPVSPLAFRVASGAVRDAVPLHALSSQGAPALAAVPQAALLSLAVAAALKGALSLLALLPMLLGDALWMFRALSSASQLALGLGLVGARALGPAALGGGVAALLALAASLATQASSLPALFTLSGLFGSAALAAGAYALRQSLRNDAATWAMLLVLGGVVLGWVARFPGLSLVTAAGFAWLAFAALSARR
jgi:hypothetical protein